MKFFTMKIYGIDLGTTNSLIGHHNTLFGEMVPSIAKISESKAGEPLRKDYDTSRSFKVNMSCGVEGNEAVVASSLVLKELVRLAEEELLLDNMPDTAAEMDLHHTVGAILNREKVEHVVIAVPAFFSDNQRQATLKAARLIGLNVRALINEPTAAAMYYSRSARRLSLVFDLGGGTFDVSVIDSRLGMFDVQSTDGIILGGNDLDSAIRSNILKKAAFKIHKMDKVDMERLKSMCEDAKIAIQKTRADYIFDLSIFEGKCEAKKYTLTEDTYTSLMKLTFKRAIVETKKVIAQSIMYGDPFDFLLVGGSTRCPYLQEWLKEEIGQIPVPVTYNPDTIVALGACLYAQMLESGEAEEKVSDVTKALSIGLHDGTVRTIIQKDSKIPIEDSIMVTNPTDATGLSIKLYQGDSLLEINNEYIGMLEYTFSEMKQAKTANVKVVVRVNNDGVISLKAKEMLKPEVEITLKRS